MFTTERKNISGDPRLAINWMGHYPKGSFITTDELSSCWLITKPGTATEELENMKAYVDSKLVTYAVQRFFVEIKPDGHNNFANRLVGLDFSRRWSDEELYKEFELTPEEISDVERWYENNKETQCGNIATWKL
jgi:hypothetical protein